MMTLVEMKLFQDRQPLTEGQGDEAKERSGKDPVTGTIPQRYQDGRGGIDLEQVSRDQRKARQQVVQGMMRRFKELLRRG